MAHFSQLGHFSILSISNVTYLFHSHFGPSWPPSGIKNKIPLNGPFWRWGPSYDLKRLQKYQNGPSSILYSKLGHLDIVLSIQDHMIVPSAKIVHLEAEEGHLEGGNGPFSLLYSKNGLLFLYLFQNAR